MIRRKIQVEIRDFADAFVELQIERQKADYALDTAAYPKSDVLDYIVSAELAINRFGRGRQTRLCGPCAVPATVTIGGTT